MPPRLFGLYIAKILDKLVTAALRYDPATQQKLNNMGDCRILIKCLKPALELVVEITDGSSRIVPPKSEDESYTAVVTGTGQGFIGLLDKSAGHSFYDSNIEISGNIALFNQLQTIAKTIDIDWEDALTQYSHPVAGHFAATVIRSFGQQFKNKVDFAQNNLESILTDELKLTPSKAELEHFFDDVDSAVERAERLVLSVQKLSDKIAPNLKNKGN